MLAKIKRVLSLGFGLVLGILTTIGGWYFCLVCFRMIEPSYTLIQTILLLFGLLAGICGQLTYGLLILRDFVNDLRRAEE